MSTVFLQNFYNKILSGWLLLVVICGQKNNLSYGFKLDQ